MATLLVLGSKPDPCLPPAGSYDDLACANASGASAARLGLPKPRYSVMSAILTSGRKAPNRLALDALQGLRTEDLYFFPRPRRGRSVWQRAGHRLKAFRTTPLYFRAKLAARGYRYDRFLNPGLDHYLDLIRSLCGQDPEVLACMERKVPSTGVVTLALGLGERAYDRVVMSGFSFEISHAYAENPLIHEWGSTRSKHAETDIAVLRCLAGRFSGLYTSEPTVSARAGLPLLPTATQPDPAASLPASAAPDP
ncbi:hypothetical protein [Algihabitans albus]|uniref:hypothetical protein n=1 Tax=Algihabitans albus TaxID=2164067 RepID=UPI0013C31ED4|nr:hypothetical protein [Algihabitans albus]